MNTLPLMHNFHIFRLDLLNVEYSSTLNITFIIHNPSCLWKEDSFNPTGHHYSTCHYTTQIEWRKPCPQASQLCQPTVFNPELGVFWMTQMSRLINFQVDDIFCLQVPTIQSNTRTLYIKQPECGTMEPIISVKLMNMPTDK